VVENKIEFKEDRFQIGTGTVILGIKVDTKYMFIFTASCVKKLLCQYFFDLLQQLIYYCFFLFFNIFFTLKGTMLRLWQTQLPATMR
jgi:hypothetical protein